MKPKLLFWIDQGLLHFGLAKFIQENLDCEIYSIFEVTEKAKKFFQNQKIVNFEKKWFYHDYILKQKSKPDIKYLEEIEKKYNLNLQLIAFNDRIFYNWNTYRKFTRDEILLILQDEIKFFESILDEIKPDFIIMAATHQQHNHIFYKICIGRGIKIIMPISGRIGINPKSPMKHSDRIYLSDELDQCLPLPDNKKIDNSDTVISQKNNPYTDKKLSYMFQTSTTKYVMAGIRYLITNDENVKTHYSYFGRSKLKVIFKTLYVELRKKYRENFMRKNLEYKIKEKSNFVYFPLHQEMERILLIGAPFFINQFEVIRNIANSLPVGYRLYVKDHVVMNYRGWRSINEMKKIMSLPNVMLFHPSVDSSELIKKSKLVISIAGSSSIEAAFYNKPSISFENVGMYKISTMTIIKSIKDLSKIIRNSLTQTVDENEMRRYEKTVMDNTFEFPFTRIEYAFEDTFKMGGYYANAEMKSETMYEFLEKFRPELTFFALKHIEKMKALT